MRVTLSKGHWKTLSQDDKQESHMPAATSCLVTYFVAVAGAQLSSLRKIPIIRTASSVKDTLVDATSSSNYI